jgi:hypothetical protein
VLVRHPLDGIQKKVFHDHFSEEPGNGSTREG